MSACRIPAQPPIETGVRALSPPGAAARPAGWLRTIRAVVLRGVGVPPLASCSRTATAPTLTVPITAADTSAFAASTAAAVFPAAAKTVTPPPPCAEPPPSSRVSTLPVTAAGGAGANARRSLPRRRIAPANAAQSAQWRTCVRAFRPLGGRPSRSEMARFTCSQVPAQRIDTLTTRESSASQELLAPARPGGPRQRVLVVGCWMLCMRA